jgi:hypothetical protein
LAPPLFKEVNVRYALLLFLFFSACQDFLDRPETHRHAPIFSGEVRSTKEHNHIELYIHRSGTLEVYLYDTFLNLVATQKAIGTIEITLQDGSREKFSLTYGAPDHHDMMQGQINKPFPNPVQAFVDVTQNGIRYQAKFDYDMNKHRDKIPHMHDARQGGQVAMIGEQHVEIVWVSSGEYRVYLSDMMRGPLSPSLATNASLIVDPDLDTPETLPLTIDPTQTFLQASGAKNPKSPLPVQVKLTLQSKPGSIDFLLSSKP